MAPRSAGAERLWTPALATLLGVATTASAPSMTTVANAGVPNDLRI
jgi:hypothetical protein